jgi:hypothetical protein
MKRLTLIFFFFIPSLLIAQSGWEKITSVEEA